METGVKEVELRDLWHRYKDDGDRGARERLVVAYSPLVKFVAGRLGAGMPSHVEDADLISYGLIGLIGSIERFEPERGIKFETFAMARIRGAIIDELRSLDWVPRSIWRAPTDDEIAKKLGVTNDELEGSLREISRTSVAALDELWSPSGGGDQIALIDTIEDQSG